MNKILVISKDLSLKQNYTKEFVRNGFHVANVSDFMDGMLTASKTEFGLIIIDEELYGAGDSLEFSRVRKYSKALIILLGLSPVNEVSTSNGDGFDAYFQRSSDPKELVTYIKSILSQHETRSERQKVKKVMSTEAAFESESESIVSIVTDLERQVAKVKSVMSGISQMRGKIREAENIVRQQQQVFEIVVNRLTEVNKHLESLTGTTDDTGLQSNPDIHSPSH